jgi:import inner membrane translocase subunit TIM21
MVFRRDVENLTDSQQSGVAYLMYTEVFSLESKTAHFGRAVDQVKNDPRCTELLGESKKITAYGEPSWNKWRRARPIAYVHEIL